MKKLMSVIGIVGVMHCGANAAENQYRRQAEIIGGAVIGGATAFLPSPVGAAAKFVTGCGRCGCRFGRHSRENQ
ncbi:MAG: hypothetical protein LBD36_02330 [Holosporales bacterium]|jgi:hypothetical protein|nr:hypothetical protein [Holosporales bacterium]